MKIKNLDLQTSWTLPLGSHTLTLGGSYLNQRLKDQTGNQLANGPNKVERYQWALFAEDEWRLTERFAVTGGLRMDKDENFGTHFSPGCTAWAHGRALDPEGRRPPASVRPTCARRWRAGARSAVAAICTATPI